MSDGRILLIDADMDVRGVPAIDRVDVIRAGGRDTDQVGQDLHHHMITGARPCFIAGQIVLLPVDP